MMNPTNNSTKSNQFTSMLKEIIENDQKQQKDGFISVAPIAFWTRIFAEYFLHNHNPSHDDLLFYVKISNTEIKEVVVFRRKSSLLPGLGDPDIDWTETVYLNLILQQLEYTLTCAICTKLSNAKQEVIIHQKISQQVYASPSRHNMEEKGKGAELCYPNIFFTIDSFEEIWDELRLTGDKLVCVEIVASDKSKMFNSVIFLGSVTHTALTRVYHKRVNSGNKWAQVMSLGLYKPSDPIEFVRMKGPGGKGYAEMAIQKIDISNEDEIATLENNTCRCPNESNQSSTSEPCMIHNIQQSKLNNSTDEIQKKSNKKKFLETVTSVSNSSPSSQFSEEKFVLKTHLTYVTLPWHKIILDILKSFEKPSTSKKPVLYMK